MSAFYSVRIRRKCNSTKENDDDDYDANLQIKIIEKHFRQQLILLTTIDCFFFPPAKG